MKHVVVTFELAGDEDVTEFTVMPGEQWNPSYYSMRAKVARQIGASVNDVHVTDYAYN